MSVEEPRAPGDDELARRAEAGDAAAFEALCLRVEGPLFGYLRGLVQQVQEAEDLTQETLLRFYRVVRTRRLRSEGGSVRGLIFGIAHNLGVDHLRRRRRTMSPEAVAAPGTAARDALLRGEVDRALARLPEAQRAALMLREFGGLTYADIAQTLGVTLGEVKIQIFRGRKRLAELLDRDGQYVGERSREL